MLAVGPAVYLLLLTLVCALLAAGGLAFYDVFLAPDTSTFLEEVFGDEMPVATRDRWLIIIGSACLGVAALILLCVCFWSCCFRGRRRRQRTPKRPIEKRHPSLQYTPSI